MPSTRYKPVPRRALHEDGRTLSVVGCTNCGGGGELATSPDPQQAGIRCTRCEGWGEVCADCGAALDVCECPTLEVDDA